MWTLTKWFAYRAVASAYCLPRVAFRIAVERPYWFVLADGTALFPMYHCGARILNTNRPMERQLKDWERVRSVLRS